MLRIAESALERLRTSGRGPRFHRFNGMVRYTISDLQASAETRAVAIGPSDTKRSRGRRMVRDEDLRATRAAGGKAGFIRVLGKEYGLKGVSRAR